MSSQTNLQAEIEAVLREFTEQAIAAYVEHFRTFAGGGRTAAPVARAPRATPAPTAKATPKPKPKRSIKKAASKKKTGARGTAADGRRLPAKTVADAKRFAAYVRDNPGQKMRAIGPALGMGTRDLALPVKKAIELGLVRKTGTRSATKYYPPKPTTKRGRK